MPIRAVAFDAVGTLIHAEPSVGQAYADAGRRHGSRRDADELRRRFTDAFAHEERLDAADGWRTSEEREHRRWRTIVTAALDDVADPEACFRELFAHFALPGAWRCDPGAAATITYCRARGLRVAMASNFDARLHGVVAGLPPLAGLDALVVSSEVGVRKPGPEFFRATAERLGCAPEEVLFVGDDPTNDVAGARAVGMRAVLVDPTGRQGASFRCLADLMTSTAAWQ